MANGSAGVTRSLSTTSWRAVVISAERAAAGDHSGCACLSRAKTPAMCGLDIEVPAIAWNSSPPLAYGELPARIWMPGAVMSGLMMSSPNPVGTGPRDENSVIDGAGAHVVVVSGTRSRAVGLAVLAM